MQPCILHEEHGVLHDIGNQKIMRLFFERHYFQIGSFVGLLGNKRSVSFFTTA